MNESTNPNQVTVVSEPTPDATSTPTVPTETLTPTYTSLDTSTLAALDVKFAKVNTKTYANYCASIIDGGGYIPEGASPELIAAAASVANNVKTTVEAQIRMATALALIDVSNQWMELKDPSGKPYKRARDLCYAMFPSLKSDTIKSYIAVGRSIYLPAARGELGDKLLPLTKLPPSVIANAPGVINDEDTRPIFAELLDRRIKEGKPITQSVIREMSKSAKQNLNALPAANDASSKSTSPPESTSSPESEFISSPESAGPSDESLTKAANEAAAQTLTVTLIKIFAPERTSDEIHLNVYEDRVNELKAELSKALRSEKNAHMFLQVFTHVMGFKVDVKRDKDGYLKDINVI